MIPDYSTDPLYLDLVASFSDEEQAIFASLPLEFGPAVWHIMRLRERKEQDQLHETREEYEAWLAVGAPPISALARRLS